MNLFEQQSAEFQARHIGVHETATHEMLAVIGEPSIDH